jgi:two-component system, cell cycle response regulator DivK
MTLKRRVAGRAVSVGAHAPKARDGRQSIMIADRPHGQATRRRTPRRRFILIVEDDPDAREMYGRYMSAQGFQVETAADGVQGLSLALAFHPDVIVMDLALPHLDGWATTRHLKGDLRTQHIPIIACTGRVLGGSVERALEAGCDSYVLKPCLPQDLIAEIGRVLAKQRPRS